jgi:ribonuclease BN (tRNA processing enzyme)
MLSPSNLEGKVVVKITLIPSAYSNHGATDLQYLTSYLINDTVAIDAGAIGFHRGPAEQAAIRRVFLSHSHFDHLASLPIFLENIAGSPQTPVVLHASVDVQESLRLDIFNGRLWPNFLALTHDNKPFVTLHTIASGQCVEADSLRITPIAVHHVVPTLGSAYAQPQSRLSGGDLSGRDGSPSRVDSPSNPRRVCWRDAKAVRARQVLRRPP